MPLVHHQLLERLHRPLDLILVPVHQFPPHIPILDNQPLGIPLSHLQLLVPVLLYLLQQRIQPSCLFHPEIVDFVLETHAGVHLVLPSLVLFEYVDFVPDLVGFFVLLQFDEVPGLWKGYFYLVRSSRMVLE